MADGIERNSAEQTGSGIAAQIGHPGVRRLVDADREEKRDQLKHDVHVVQGHARLASILTRGAAIPAVSSASRAHRKQVQITCITVFLFLSPYAVLPVRSILP